MAIRFTCACGKKLQARDDLVGRRMKCPDCDRVLTIPGEPAAGDMGHGPANEATAPEPGAANAPAPSVPSASASIAARPGARTPAHAAELSEPMEVHSEIVLERDEARMPASARPAAAAPSRGATAAPVASWAAASLHQTATPWLPGDQQRFDPQSAREDKRDCGCAVGKIVLGLVVIGLVVAAFVFVRKPTEAFSEKTHADVEYIPADASGIVSIRVADLWKELGLDRLDDEARGTLEDQIFAKLNLGPDDARRFRHSGLRAADIERATLVLADAKGLANSVTAAVTKVEPALAPMG